MKRKASLANTDDYEVVADLFACYAEELVSTRDELLAKLEKAKGANE